MPAHCNPEPDSEITAMVIAEAATHVTVAVQIERSWLRRHRRLLEQLLAAAREG